MDVGDFVKEEVIEEVLQLRNVLCDKGMLWNMLILFLWFFVVLWKYVWNICYQ